MIAFLKRLFRLFRLCASGREGRIGLVYLAAVLALGFVGIWVSVRLIAWNAAFYNAVQQVDGPELVRQVGVFLLLVGSSAALFLSGRYVQKLLEITWRKRLTEIALDRWLSGQAYWRLRAGAGAGVAIDNPDQRVADDCRLFVEKATNEGVDFIHAVVSLVSFATVLWGLSTFPLAFELAGHAVEIPRYMVWAAFLYVAAASALTHWLGAPLKALNFEQQKREADFRFALAHLREQAEAVALHRGEAAERRGLDARFAAIAVNWRALMRRDLILGCFTRPYMQTVLRVPLFLALPGLIAGKITLGGLMQLANAFSNVVTTMSWFVFSYRDLAELAATASRLDHFLAATDPSNAAPPDIAVRPSPDGALRTRGLTLSDPRGASIAAIPDVTVGAGGCLWIRGRSGLGKSTLLKAIAGLWPHGAGVIERPAGTIAVLPQRPYAPLGGRTEAALYPDGDGA
ncbi:ABC transporter ATP-binding protein/permease, partial [Methylopila musalis]